jgi:molybdenum cofactor guanylyltransferase
MSHTILAEEKLPFRLANEITGFILAGGQSRRMGRDKASLPWRDGTFLDHAIARMNQVTAEVFVSGAINEAKAPTLPDSIPGRGPLGGLHAALAHSKTNWILVMAVDMPLVTPDLLQFIAERCDKASLAVVPSLNPSDTSHPSDASSVLQPLCAAYHRRLRPAVEQALVGDDLSIHRLLERVSTGMMSAETKALRVIEEKELLAAGFPAQMLLNVNTPEDLKRARALARTLHVE